MGFYRGPNIVRDGLVLALDAGSTKSYPRSGTTWFDLSGNGNNAILNSVDFSSNNGGIFRTNGSSTSFIDVPGPDLTSSSYTVIGAARYSGLGGDNRGRMINAKNNNWLMGHWGNSVLNYFAVGWVTGVGAGGTDNLWRIYAATGLGTYNFYSNGALNTSNGNGTAGPNGFNIGKIGYSTTEVSNGEVAFLFAYNRVLSPQEIAQNFNATRTRFGI